MFQKKKHIIPLLFFVLLLTEQLTISTPSLTVIFVIDQCAYHYLNKLYPYLQGGIKTLMDKGLSYTHAYFPHAMPATATGHTALNTGTFAKDHGIVSNNWYSSFNKSIKSDTDDRPESAVFNPHGGIYPFGKSAANSMVDGISDQIMLNSQPNNPAHVLSFSYKSRAAIGTAGTLGKAVWFDDKTGLFTSSKAYYDQLPAWLVQGNNFFFSQPLKKIVWDYAYHQDSDAYKFHDIHNYTYASRPSLIGRTIDITTEADSTEPHELFLATPRANEILLALSYYGIKYTLTTHENERMLVWINLSSLDKVGHIFGPWAAEPIDMIYHLDKQIQTFMEKLSTIIPAENTLYVLTADHGISPIAELMQQRGIKSARRILIKELIHRIDTLLVEKFNLQSPCIGFKIPTLYIDPEQFNAQPASMQKNIIRTIIRQLYKQPGIKRVWQKKELEKKWFGKNSIESFFQNQLFPGRSGDLIVQTFPYCAFFPRTTGTAHRTGYHHDTHVPLLFYKSGVIPPKKSITRKIWPLQLANTVADIWNVPRPSASVCNELKEAVRAYKN